MIQEQSAQILVNTYRTDLIPPPRSLQTNIQFAAKFELQVFAQILPHTSVQPSTTKVSQACSRS
jgi:hypothetical protein